MVGDLTSLLKRRVGDLTTKEGPCHVSGDGDSMPLKQIIGQIIGQIIRQIIGQIIRYTYSRTTSSLEVKS